MYKVKAFGKTYLMMGKTDWEALKEKVETTQDPSAMQLITGTPVIEGGYVVDWIVNTYFSKGMA